MVPSPAVAGLPVGAAGFAAGSAWPSRSEVQRPSRQVAECAHCSRRFQHTKEPNHAAKLLHSVCFGAPAWTSQCINLLGKHPENNPRPRPWLLPWPSPSLSPSLSAPAQPFPAVGGVDFDATAFLVLHVQGAFCVQWQQTTPCRSGKAEPAMRRT